MALQPQFTDLLELRHQAHALGIASHHLVNTVLTGLYASVFRGQGMNFEEVREYRPGDEIRNMDWRVTARTGTPHMKVYREERERAVMLVVDAGPHMAFGTRGTFKSVQSARAAALLGWAANAHQDRVGAVLFGDQGKGPRFFRPSRTRQSLWRMLRALSEEITDELPERPPLPEALEKLSAGTPTGALIFVIADLNAADLGIEQHLGRLCQNHEVVLLPVDDPADRELPAMGRVVFGTPGGERVEVDTDSEEGRRHYRERWNSRRKSLESMAWRLGVDLIPIPTQADVHSSLLRGMHLRARRLGRHR